MLTRGCIEEESRILLFCLHIVVNDNDSLIDYRLCFSASRAFARALPSPLGGEALVTATGPVYVKVPGVDVSCLIILVRAVSLRYLCSVSLTPGDGCCNKSSANSAQD